MPAMVGISCKLLKGRRTGTTRCDDEKAYRFQALRVFGYIPYGGADTSDVLILTGEKDHFIPLAQVDRFKERLVNARSATTLIFTEEEGGHEHNQPGAVTLFHAAFFDWIDRKFGEKPNKQENHPCA